MKKNSLRDIDWSLISPAIILSILSLTTLFSINFSLFKNQLFFFLISIIAFIFFSQINYNVIKLYSIPIYIASIILLALVLFIGLESRGSIRWFEIFGIRIQFSEILKPFLAVSLASFLAEKENYSPRTILLIGLFLLPIAFLIFVQPDLGNTLIYITTTVLTLMTFGFPLKFFFLGFAATGLMLPIIWNFMRAYQKQRIFTFLHPTDPLGSSYNTIQSIIAIGSGMLLGKGLGQGTQSGLRFLPERHTDFIFATISENLGFIGSTLLILTFFYLLYKIFNIFLNANETFPRIFSAIAFCLIISQFFINIAMNLGIIPIVGVTLPFVSYGGSSLLSNFILLGILSCLNKKDKIQNVLEIK